MTIPYQTNLASITDLREKTNAFINTLNQSNYPTIVLKDNKPQIVALSLYHYQQLQEELEDLRDSQDASRIIAVSKNKKEKSTSFEEASKKMNYSLS